MPTCDDALNARLIAAAPEMAESLREVTDILGRIFRQESVAGEVLDAIDTARALLGRIDGHADTAR